MNVKKTLEALKQLYQYGETPIVSECTFLVERGLVYQSQGRLVVTRSWIEYCYHFQKKEEFLQSLLCFEPAYQTYLLQQLLVTALKMRESGNTAGLWEFVAGLPKLAGAVLKIVRGLYGANPAQFPLALLEAKIESEKNDFRELNWLIFNGPPNYQRLWYYFDLIQQYETISEASDLPLGGTIDAIWSNGRKIATVTMAPLQKERPIVVLAPFEFPTAIQDSNMRAILSYPWRLFMLILGIIREQYEVEKDRAISLRVNNEHVEVVLTSGAGREFLYGALNSFAAYLCKALNFLLFPQAAPDLEAELQWLLEYGVFVVRDGEYRLATESEDQLYLSSLGITFITGSKQLRANMERFIDELREKK
jgi:hypothetical protein